MAGLGESSENYFRFVFGRARSQSFDDQDLTYLLLGHQAYISRFKDGMIEEGKDEVEIYSIAKAKSDYLSGLIDDEDAAILQNRTRFEAHQKRGQSFLWMVDGSQFGRRYRENFAKLYGFVADAVIHLNFYIYRTIPRSAGGRGHAVISFGISRVIHLLRSIRSLWNTDSSVEALALLRPLYEIYCFCAATIAREDIANWVWESYFDTGSKKWRPPAPKVALLKVGLLDDVEIFDRLYPEFCSYVHFGMERMGAFGDKYFIDIEQIDK